MTKKIISMLLALCVVLTLIPMSVMAAEDTAEAVYLGIRDYGTVTRDEVLSEDFDGYRFSVDGKEVLYKVKFVEDYAIQNVLQEGYIYDITVSDGTVTSATLKDKGCANVVMGTVSAVSSTSVSVAGKTLSIGKDTAIRRIDTAAGGATVSDAKLSVGDSVKIIVSGTSAKSIYVAFVAEDYASPVHGTPGVKTLKNFLATAMGPLGTALYVYGGSWDWEDDASSNQSTTIGLSQSWIDFFQRYNSMDYSYDNEEDAAHNFYPVNEWNQYYYGGIDCSAFVGWVIYNTINTESGLDGYVGSSTKMANKFADYGWGVKSRDAITCGSDLHVGDVFSMSGHVWIVVGVCDDDSVVIVHSTASVNRDNVYGGGGVQLSAMNPKNPTDKNCDAYRLATYYMSACYGDWFENYDIMLRDFDSYTAIASGSASKDLAGKFSWDLSGEKLLSDPDGYADMGAEAILADLFKSACAPYSREKVEPFTDSTVADWFNADVLYAHENGLMTGVTATQFAPAASLTRAQVVTVLYRMAGSPAVKNAAAFSDVDAGAYYTDAVAWASENGIVKGNEDGTFAPNRAITREQMAVMLCNFARQQGRDVSSTMDLSTYADFASVSSYAVDALRWACSAGILNGSNGYLTSGSNATRAQAAAIFHRFAVLLAA